MMKKKAGVVTSSKMKVEIKKMMIPAGESEELQSRQSRLALELGLRF